MYMYNFFFFVMLLVCAFTEIKSALDRVLGSYSVDSLEH